MEKGGVCLPFLCGYGCDSVATYGMGERNYGMGERSDNDATEGTKGIDVEGAEGTKGRGERAGTEVRMVFVKSNI